MLNACTISAFKCTKRTVRTLQRYCKMANLAKDNKEFVKIFPWESICDRSNVNISKCKNSKYVHYVSVNEKSQSLCGWMMIEVSKGKGVYISEISTVRSANIKGVGSALHDRLLKDYPDAPYVYLYPLDEAAKQAYLRWGYREYDGLPYMFYTRHGATVPQHVLDGLKQIIEDRARQLEEDRMEVINIVRKMLSVRGSLDTDVIQAYDEKIRSDEEFVQTVMDVYTSYEEIQEEDEDEAEDYVRDVINEMLSKK